YYSESPNTRLFVNAYNQLEWKPEKGGQFTARIPEQRLSQVGDKVEITYLWMTDGAHNCADCFACYNCYDGSIECIAGTSDFRVGLFQADGEYVTSDGYSVSSSSIWTGYKGYAFRFGPNMIHDPGIYAAPPGSGRWVDCTGEVHKTGEFQKKPASLSNLLYSNDGLIPYIYGFGLPPGRFSQFTISVERLSSISVKCSITLNGQTQTWTDTNITEQAQKIDVIAIHMRNGRPYSRLVLGKCDDMGTADLNSDDKVDYKDLGIIIADWLKGTYEPRGIKPDANGLILHYSFDGTLNNNITSIPNLVGTGFNLTKFAEAAAGAVKYGSPNPMTAVGTSADFQNFTADPGSGLFTNDTGINSAIDLNTIGKFTVEAFIKPRSLRQSVIIRKNSSSTTAGQWYLDFRPTGEVGFSINADANILLSGSGSIMTDTWYHVAGVFDETAGMKLYIDGAEVKSGTYKTRPADSDRSLGIGCIIRDNANPPASSGQFYDGLIDEIKVYDYALSEDELIYKAYNGQAVIYTPLDSQANLYEDDIIDFKDFAEFALHWLDSCQ
ncbi:MAG: LamG domain-containing protein, partial [Candidatus Brocadiia bacterium]